jgi:hypothetical protein
LIHPRHVPTFGGLRCLLGDQVADGDQLDVRLTGQRWVVPPVGLPARADKRYAYFPESSCPRSVQILRLRSAAAHAEVFAL